MTYRWIITADHIDGNVKSEALGFEGGSHKIDQPMPTNNETDFQLLDDDMVLYYSGKLYGDFDGFEPLDDFGMAYAGCTTVKLRNSAGKFEIL
tara:strand:- start:5652 stop:5930 length:279 start_codon:yes stop_codon:yes gene_type:complete